ncbi:MAG: TRAP transporter small permease [Spirochaetaceae bacterium]|nr:TRAP transporter small permease [Spirochaetaceae bacterium]
MENKLLRILEKICGALLCVMVTLLFIQVVTRYIFRGSVLWAGEMAVWIFAWISFLGSVVLFARKKHIVIDMLSAFLPKGVNDFLSKINTLIVFVFFAILFYYSIPVVASYSNQTATSIGVSKFYLFLSLPVASVLIMAWSLYSFIKSIRRGE